MGNWGKGEFAIKFEGGWVCVCKVGNPQIILFVCTVIYAFLWDRKQPPCTARCHFYVPTCYTFVMVYLCSRLTNWDECAYIRMYVFPGFEISDRLRIGVQYECDAVSLFWTKAKTRDWCVWSDVVASIHILSELIYKFVGATNVVIPIEMCIYSIMWLNYLNIYFFELRKLNCILWIIFFEFRYIFNIRRFKVHRSRILNVTFQPGTPTHTQNPCCQII